MIDHLNQALNIHEYLPNVLNLKIGITGKALSKKWIIFTIKHQKRLWKIYLMHVGHLYGKQKKMPFFKPGKELRERVDFG